jgi:phosphoribosyl-ATP pyrophosphohydrolase
MATEQILAKLWATLESRRSDPASYTGAFVQNPFKLRQKVIREAYEVLEAHQARLARLDTLSIGEHEEPTGFGAKHHVAAEMVDLLVHLYILLASIDVTPDDVFAVLERRHAKWTAKPAADGGVHGARRESSADGLHPVADPDMEHTVESSE